MSRRVFLLITLAVLGLLGIATAPWALAPDGISSSVARQMRERFGVDFQVRGRSTIALLPVPRLKFEDVTLAALDGSFRAEGGTVRGELRILPLLIGRPELAEVALSDSRITLSPARLGDRDYVRSLVELYRDRPGLSWVRRVLVAGGSIAWGGGEHERIDAVQAVLSWRDPEGRMEARAAGVWRGERVEITEATLVPALVAEGKASPFTLDLAAQGSRLSLTGNALLGAEPRVTGTSSLSMRSVRELTRWSGLEIPLGPWIERLSLAGDFSADRRRLSWPAVTLSLGEDRLEGTLAVRVENGRPAVTGTLAADTLDLSSFFHPLTGARTGSGLWSEDRMSLTNAGGGDLDVRLSAAAATAGRFKFEEAGASLIVRSGRVEATLSRANFQKGTLKGRLSLASLPQGLDLKAQMAFERIDLASTLTSFGSRRWITGQATGHLIAEGTGATAADLMRQIHGRAGIAVQNGELIGVGIDEALRRADRQPLSTVLDARGARTPFTSASLNLSLAQGVAEIAEGSVHSPETKTSLQGHLSLLDGTLALRAHVEPAGARAGSAPIAFEVRGGWNDVTLIPDVKALIERSRAAKPLLGQERPQGPAPVSAGQ